MNERKWWQSRDHLIQAACLLAIAIVAIWAMTDPLPEEGLNSADGGQKCEYSEKRNLNPKSEQNETVVVSCLQSREVNAKPSGNAEKENYIQQSRDFLHKFVPDAISLLTWILGVSTALLWLDTRHLAKDSAENLAVVHKEFLASHRPKLRARRVVTINRHDPTKVRVEISNVGDSIAKVTAIGCDIFLYSDDISPIWNAIPNNCEPVEIKIGMEYRAEFQANQFMKDIWNEKSITCKPYTIMVIFIVNYADSDGNARNLSIARYFREKEGFYAKVTDENMFYECEYED